MCGYNTFDLDWTLSIALSRVGDSLSYIADVIGWNLSDTFYGLSGRDCNGKLLSGYSALSLANVDYAVGYNIEDSLSYIADVIGWNSNGVFYALSGKDLVGEQMCGYSALTLELHAYDRSVNAIGFFCLPFKKRSKELILTSL